MLKTIRRQLLVLTVIPVVAVIVALTVSMISSRIDDANASLDAKVHLLLDQLGNLSEFAFFTGNNEEITQLARSALNLPDVESITIVNAQGQVMTAIDKNHQIPARSLKTYEQEVFSSSLNINDFGQDLLFEGEDKQYLGKIELVMSLLPQQSLRQSIIFKSAVLGVALLIMALTLAIWTSYKIVSPIESITRVINRIKAGDLSARVNIQSSRELELLASGINSMTDTIAESQRALESKIQQATMDLMATVDELTMKNHELNIARNDALSSVRAKTEFLARMSHEIRTPLNAVMGFCSLLEQPVSEITRHEYIDIILSSARQLHHIVDDVLTFSKLESNALVLERRELSLVQCIESSVLMLMPLANKKQINFILLIHQSLPHKWIGDEVRLTQIINNLVSNAIKFTDRGQVVVEAQYHSDDSQLEISVSDTGVGIASYQKEQLFQPFIQADTTITRRYGGAGLGLSISKKLAGLMGGDITVVSEQGQGSQFKLLINSVYRVPEAPSMICQSLQGKSVLLIDQHVISRRSLRNTLLCYGINVFAPPSTSGAISLLSTQPFDVVLIGVSADDQSNQVKELLDQLTLLFKGPLVCLVSGIHDFLDDYSKPNLIVGHKPMARSSLYQLLVDQMGGGQSTDVVDKPAAIDKKPLQGANFLVVEDNTFNQILFRELLSEYGASVDIACHGGEALEKTASEQYDMILMDIHMPDMDGFTVAGKVSEQEEGLNNNTTIIALTADVLVDAEAMTDSVFVDVIYKPVNKDTFLSTIGLHLEKTIKVLPSSTAMANASEKVLSEIDKLGQQLLPLLEHKDALAKGVAHQLKGVVGYFELSEIIEPVRNIERLIDQKKWGLAHEELSLLLTQTLDKRHQATA